MLWRSVAAAASIILVLSGCNRVPQTADRTPEPTTTPTLADPVELDYYATLVVDDGAGHALVADWKAEKLHAIDPAGGELWSIDAHINDDPGGGVEAFSVGGTVVIHDQWGKTIARSWDDGGEAWSFQMPDAMNACHPAQQFGAQTTGTGPILGGDELILLEYLGVSEDGGCEPTSENGNAVVYALDPRTGQEAWPALSIGPDGKTFGGRLMHISPDRRYGVVSWQDGEESMITRVALDTGRHTTVPITSARSIDDTGLDYYDVFPTNEPTSLLYVYGSDDPDDPYTAAVTRTAQLSLPDGLPDTDSETLEGIDAPEGVIMEDTFDPVCATELVFTPSGEPACVQPQLFASAIKYQGSDGSPQGWFADAPEMALESIGAYGTPQCTPVDSSDGTLLVVPGQESGIVALSAETGRTVWSAGDYMGDAPWGGQGVLPELDLVVVTAERKTSFYASDTGEFVADHLAGEYAQLSSGRRVVLVAEDESTTMWSVIDV